MMRCHPDRNQRHPELHRHWAAALSIIPARMAMGAGSMVNDELVMQRAVGRCCHITQNHNDTEQAAAESFNYQWWGNDVTARKTIMLQSQSRQQWGHGAKVKRATAATAGCMIASSIWSWTKYFHVQQSLILWRIPPTLSCSMCL